jgi:PhnB protein
MLIIPGLVFSGTCEEALHFYKKCFGGEITYLERYKDTPVESNPVFGDKILHAKYEFEGNIFFASDSFENRQVKTGENISLTLEFDSKEQLVEVYEKISEGAKIKTPLQESFWGASFAILTDKFGITWTLNYIKIAV